jgi:hypothetical protein
MNETVLAISRLTYLVRKPLGPETIEHLLHVIGTQAGHMNAMSIDSRDKFSRRLPGLSRRFIGWQRD